MVANATRTWNGCPQCGKFSGFDGHCGKCGFILKGEDAKVRMDALLKKAARDAYAKPVRGIAYREELGRIDMAVGRRGDWNGNERVHGSGLSKIRDKHDIDTDHLAETLSFGKVLRMRYGDDENAPESPNRRAVVHGNFIAILAKSGDGWEIASHYHGSATHIHELEKIAASIGKETA